MISAPKKIFLGFVMLCIVGCMRDAPVITPPVKPRPVPDRFIGKWQYFKSDYIREIRRDRTTFGKHDTEPNITNWAEYRLIHYMPPRTAYIALRGSRNSGEPDYDIVKLFIDIEYYPGKPERIEWIYLFGLKNEDYWHMSEEEFLKTHPINDIPLACDTELCSSVGYYRVQD